MDPSLLSPRQQLVFNVVRKHAKRGPMRSVEIYEAIQNKPGGDKISRANVYFLCGILIKRGAFKRVSVPPTPQNGIKRASYGYIVSTEAPPVAEKVVVVPPVAKAAEAGAPFRASTENVLTLPANFDYTNVVPPENPAFDIAKVEAELLEKSSRIVTTFKDDFRRRLLEAMREVLDEVESKLVVQVQNSRVKSKLPRVVLVGPREDQFNMLQDEYGEVLNLVHFDKDRNAANPLFKSARASAATVVWVDFVPHDLVDSVKRLPQVRLVKGGMSALRDALLDITVAI